MSITYCDYALYCRLWPAQLYDIFLHYSTKDAIFGEKNVIEHKMCVLIFPTIFV